MNHFSSKVVNLYEKKFMKSLTIHNIDIQLMQIIEAKAAEWGLSLNKTIKRLLKEHLSNEPVQKDANPFNEIAGKWSATEHKAFEKNTAQFNEIDKTLWQ